jgi:uncharacterized metal-binding protein
MINLIGIILCILGCTTIALSGFRTFKQNSYELGVQCWTFNKNLYKNFLDQKFRLNIGSLYTIIGTILQLIKFISLEILIAIIVIIVVTIFQEIIFSKIEDKRTREAFEKCLEQNQKR